MEKNEQSVILVVDDTPANLDVLAGILSPLYQVRVVRDSARVLESVEKNPPHLILLDIMMPGIDGYEICRQLKNNPAIADIPVIFVTAKSEAEDEKMGFDVGGMDFLTKPVSPPIVLARIRTHLALSLARSDLKRHNELLQENLKLREDMEQITQHDLKSPLTAFVNIPRLLAKEKNMTGSQVELLQMLGDSAHEMLSIITRSLDLVKMERGTYRLLQLPVDVCGVLRHNLRDLSMLTAEKKFTVHIQVDGKPMEEGSACLISGEEALVHSMFGNLLKNAVEASPPGEMISVDIARGNDVTISISNKGAIPIHIRDRFFGRYVTEGKKDGNGLGAYSARLMARTLGGDVAVNTSDPAGTRMEIRLPLFYSPETLEKHDSPKIVVTKPRSSMRVLVIDDYAYVRKCLSGILKQMGFFNIVEVENGEQGSLILKSDTFDLILSDWQMPGCTGLELLNQLRSQPHGKTTPFIMVTGVLRTEMIQQAAKAGVTDCVSKPFTPEIMREKIDKWLPALEEGTNEYESSHR
jgi:CheY-like chemotaxis protein